MATTIGEAISWQERENAVLKIFQPNHVTMAEVNPVSDIIPYPAIAPSSSHQRIPPWHHIYEEALQKKAAELPQEKSTSLGIHLLENQRLPLGLKTQPDV